MKKSSIGILVVTATMFCPSEAFSINPFAQRRKGYTSIGEVKINADRRNEKDSILFSISDENEITQTAAENSSTNIEDDIGSPELEHNIQKDTGRRILELAIPALGALLIDPLLTLADTAFVGRFSNSPYELAGMGSATAVLTFSFYIFNFLCTATTPLVASKRAAGKESEALAVGGQALSLAFSLGVTLSLSLIALQYPLLDIMGTAISGQSATQYALNFMTIRAFAAPAVFCISASTGILRGYLDTKTPIYILLAANIINFLLDVVFIVVAGLGPAGAALATTIAEWISALLFLFVLAGRLPSADGDLGKKDTTEKTLVVTPSLSIPSWEEIRPLILASSAVFLRTTILQLFISASAAFAARGSDIPGGAAASISAHQIAIQLWILCSYTSDALAAASQVLVADAIGRNDTKDVHAVAKTIFVYSTVLGSILAGILFLGFSTNFLLTLFTTDNDTQAALLNIAALIVLAQPLNSLVFAADGVLQGASEFPYQAKSMALSAFVASMLFLSLQSIDATNELVNVWSSLICLQFMRGITSAYKIFDENGPINLMETPADAQK